MRQGNAEIQADSNGAPAEEISRENQRIWEANADFWDGQIGEGNDFQDLLIEPCTLRLLALEPGETVLDVACGAGRFARKMASLGANVVAFDFCGRFLDLARAKEAPKPGRIEYRQIDATDPEALKTLGERRFDAATATMALMDIPDIEPLFDALGRLLKPGARLVFSVSHPCFHSNFSLRTVEERLDAQGRLENVFSIITSRYLSPNTQKGEGIAGQPRPYYYFHRSLQDLLVPAFRAGFAVDGLEEPALPHEPQNKDALSWSNFPEIPPILVARLRLSAG